MKRNVRYIDGSPETMTLPRAKNFIKGKYTNYRDAGCVAGQAYYAFGVEIYDDERQPGKKARLADLFAAQVCALAFKMRVVHAHRKIHETAEEYVPWRLKTKRSIEDTYKVFDRNANKAGKKKIAKAWRIVAHRWGYDVKASEPGWKP